ncbi:hypothetical protein [Pseudovibrio denitrificans]|uniref:hypothetical protein n=1 Tax=Pseudovibrio denitrificans TaxID=258256 RepID=UPI000B2DA6FA|nr:hypothetical protein [Pseudovibrio denitrificans]
MEQSDGEIVFFETTRSGVKLLIQWNCFSSQKTKDVFYEIECSEIIAQSTFD